MEGSSTENAELVVIYLRKDLLRADKAILAGSISSPVMSSMCRRLDI